MQLVTAEIKSISELPSNPAWLYSQTSVVVGVGEAVHPCADVMAVNHQEAERIAARIAQFPQAALALAQVLRAQQYLPTPLALDVESMAFATLQSGSEFHTWLHNRGASTVAQSFADDAILLARDDNTIVATLNRPQLRNSISVEMRDALVETLTLVGLDESIEKLILNGAGGCFSTGGELSEFGTARNGAHAHWLRSVHSPARLMASLSDKICCQVHGACIGSGLELPAFAKTVVAKSKTFFQLPELSMGLIPGAGGTVSVANRIGRHRLAWMVLTGKKINTKNALEWGLIDAIDDY